MHDRIIILLKCPSILSDEKLTNPTLTHPPTQACFSEKSGITTRRNGENLTNGHHLAVWCQLVPASPVHWLSLQYGTKMFVSSWTSAAVTVPHNCVETDTLNGMEGRTGVGALFLKSKHLTLLKRKTKIINL